MTRDEAWKQKWVAWGEEILLHDRLECEVPSCPLPVPRTQAVPAAWQAPADWREDYERSIRKMRETRERGLKAKLRKIQAAENKITRRVEPEPVLPVAVVPPTFVAPGPDVVDASIIVPEPVLLAFRPAADHALRLRVEASQAHYAETALRRRILAGVPDPPEPPEVFVPEHVAGYPCGRSIQPRRVPWVDSGYFG